MAQTRKLLALLAATVLSLTACGDDGDDAEESLSEEQDDGGGEGDVERFCEARVEFQASFESLEDPEDPEDLEQVAEVVADFLEDQAGTIEELEEAAPADIRDDVQTLVAGFERFAETGDVEDLEGDEELEEATSRLEAFSAENCDGAEVPTEIEGEITDVQDNLSDVSDELSDLSDFSDELSDLSDFSDELSDFSDLSDLSDELSDFSDDFSDLSDGLSELPDLSDLSDIDFGDLSDEDIQAICDLEDFTGTGFSSFAECVDFFDQLAG